MLSIVCGCVQRRATAAGAAADFPVCVCVCVCDAQSLNKLKVFTMIHHFYGSVCTAAMFLSVGPLLTAFPPSQHDNKTMYSPCIPTAPRYPICMPPCPLQGSPRTSLLIVARRLSLSSQQGVRNIASVAFRPLFSVHSVAACKRKIPGGRTPTAPGFELTIYGVEVKCVSGILLPDVARYRPS